MNEYSLYEYSAIVAHVQSKWVSFTFVWKGVSIRQGLSISLTSIYTKETIQFNNVQVFGMYMYMAVYVSI